MAAGQSQVAAVVAFSCGTATPPPGAAGADTRLPGSGCLGVVLFVDSPGSRAFSGALSQLNNVSAKCSKRC